MADQRVWSTWANLAAGILLVVAIAEGLSLASAHRERDEALSRLDDARADAFIYQEDLQEAEQRNVQMSRACAQVANSYLHEIQALQVFAANLYAEGDPNILGLGSSLLGLTLNVIAGSTHLPRGFDFESYLQLGLGNAVSGVLRKTLPRCGLHGVGDFDNVHPDRFAPSNGA